MRRINQTFILPASCMYGMTTTQNEKFANVCVQVGTCATAIMQGAAA